MTKRLGLTRRIALVLSLALVMGACGGDDDSTSSGSASGSGDATSGSAADVERVVREALEAENDGDGKAFVALFTDKGLEEYDSGTREEISSGESENFGQEKLELIDLSNTEVDGEGATTDVEVAPEEFSVAQVLFLATFSLVQEGDEWLIDGFEFKGSPAPGDDATVLDVKAQDYAFAVSDAEAPGDVAFTFQNVGKEQHEMTLFRAPDGTDLAKAKAALETLDGQELEDLPDGYEADHVSFVEVDQKVDVAFAEPLEEGTYFMVCYIPQGGFGEEGPVNPEGKPHVALGMIAPLTIE